MLMRSLPLRPMSSSWEIYFRKSCLTLPRTIWRKRLWSCSILRVAIGNVLTLGISSREDARNIVQDIGRTNIAVSVVLHHAALHHIDLLLRVLVHHVGNQAGELDGIFLVFEQF